MDHKCGTCGKETDTCYTDSGVLGMLHGQCQCCECYAVYHPFCPKCRDLTSEMWEYCAHCGHYLGDALVEEVAKSKNISREAAATWLVENNKELMDSLDRSEERVKVQGLP